LDLSKLAQYNQGDDYFPDQLGFETPTTAIGETTKPVFETIIENIKDASKENI
jgi:hypothetical protein